MHGLILAILSSLTVIGAGSSGQATTCSEAAVLAGMCSVEIVDGAAVAQAAIIVDEGASAPPESSAQEARLGGSPVSAGGARPTLGDDCQSWTDLASSCARNSIVEPGITPAEPAESDDAQATDTRPITLEDIAIFTPIVGELIVEPDGWGVVGTPTNFYATAETHTIDGELFDTPIQVRWTPSSYRFDYGDGTTEDTDASGAPWRGTDESWTETATSHTYETRDDVTASLTVIFTAEVDAGGGWVPVPGSLPVDAPAVAIKIFEVDTVLTHGDCNTDPTAAGCD